MEFQEFHRLQMPASGSWPNLTDPSSLQVTTENLDALTDFQNFGYYDIIVLLRGVVDY